MTNYALSRAFVDPLGRNALTATSVSNASNDLVVSAYTQFDSWDRPTQVYKPFTLNVANGMSSLNYYTPQSQVAGSSPHITKVYEADPRSRILKEAKYGNSITSNRIVTTDFCILDGQELKQELGLSTSQMADWMQNASTSTGRAANTFLKSTITDEDQKSIIEYANAIGQKVASVRYNGNQQLLTLSYYDSKGNLTKVINPKNQTSDYIYNDLGMLFKKITVDGGIVHAIFDKSGQVVIEQDENGLAEGYIRGYEYDDMGRMIRQVRITNYSSSLFSNITNNTYKSLSWRNPSFDAGSLFNAANYKVEKEWFYGTHSFDKNNNTFLTQTRNYLNNSLTNAKGKLTHTISYNRLGQPVEYRFMSYTEDGFPKWELTQFSEVSISTATPGFVVRADFDEYGLQGNLLTQNMDLDGNGTMDFQYHYTYDQWSRVKEIFISYNDLKANGYKVAEYEYDDALGLVTQLSYFDSETNTCKNKVVDQIKYTYDVKDRVTNITSQLFDWSLYYDNQSPTGTPTQQNWNGNINATRARYKLNGTTNAPNNFTTNAYTDYQYEYDAINRLTRATADMHNGTPNGGTFGNALYTYDEIGNLLRLDRDNGLFVDRYRYQYQTNTNKMVGIAVDEVHTNSINSNVANYTYNYDNNGNLTYDSKRDITVTGYGRANLPYELSTKPSHISYLYDIADLRVYKREGAKERGGAVTKEWYLRLGGKELGIYNISSGQFTWYVHGNERIAKIEHQLNNEETPAIIGGSFGELVYTSEEPPLDPREEEGHRGREEGRGSGEFSEVLTVPANPPVPNFVFYVHDHLGNTRVTYSTALTCGSSTQVAYTLEAVLDYYPYGKILREYTNGENERYLTTQHERDKETGLDYRGARFYDADVARFLSLDPLAMDFPEWSDYNYVLGNPIKFLDSDGRAPLNEYEYNTKTKTYTKVSNAGGEDYDIIHYTNGLSPVHLEYKKTTLRIENKYGIAGTRTGPGKWDPPLASGSVAVTDNPIEMLLDVPRTTVKAGSLLFLAVIKSKADDVILKSVDNVASGQIDNIHRIGGNSIKNLNIKKMEETLDPPGISVLKADTPYEAAKQMREQFPKAKKLQELSKTVSSSNKEKIQKAGFDIIKDPTKRFPNHHRIIHKDGVEGFKNQDNLKKLSEAFNNTTKIE